MARYGEYTNRVKHKDMQRKGEQFIEPRDLSATAQTPAREPAFASRGNIVDYSQREALAGESYEDAALALNKVEALQNFRRSLRGRSFGGFYDIFEDITNINKAPLSDTEKGEQIKSLIDAMEEKAGKFSPRVADLYLAILSEARGESYEPNFEITRDKIVELKNNDDLRVLFGGDILWELKLNRIENRLQGYLAGVRALDKRDGREMNDDERKEREEKLKKAPTRPPERRNESKPGMDEMERLKEGERAPVIWSIHPAYGGYYREQSLSVWDSKRNTWVEPAYEYSDVELTPLCEKENFKKRLINLTMRAEVVAGKWVSLPIPYTHGLHKIETGGAEHHIQQDQNGDIVVMAEGKGKVEIIVVLSPKLDKIYGPLNPAKIKTPDMPAAFSKETVEEMIKIKRDKRGDIARARALASFTRRHLTYSNESKYNSIYETHENGYFAAIDEHKKADCDVANTYFAALCAQLDVPVRHCVGHSVKGKDKAGASNIHSGTGHAWSEVWDKQENKWTRIDATSSGDPNLEEQVGEGESSPGDYGEQEAIRPSDEQLEELRQKLAERKEQLSYTKKERQLAEATGVELKEARQIVKEMRNAEQTRLPNGELVVDVLSRLFNAIVESRKTIAQEYTGPVRKSEGGESIENIVRHKISIMTGESDPVSREKPEQEEKEEKIIGGFDLYMIGDKSGSMASSVGEEELWKLQRRAEYLIFSSLYQFEQAIKRAGISKKEDMSVRTQGISFRGSGVEDIDLDKPLSGDFSAADKVKLWYSLTNQGGGNGDVAALSYILSQIQEEKARIKQSGQQDNRLRLIIACSDGNPDNPAQVQQLAEELGKLNAVVVGVGLTETAAAVPIIYNTPYSRGDIARDINDLPAIVAKHVVGEAIKFFPECTKESAKQIINGAIAKFKHL